MRTPSPGFLSPVVRRLGAELGIDAARLAGTGRAGRVTRGDVLRAAATATPAAPADPGAIPFTSLRRQMATRLVGSKRTAAHAYCSVEADLQAVERVRAVHGERFRAEEGFGLTYLPFFARATVAALGEFRNLNGTVGADELRISESVHLGIAVDLDGAGLLIPVVHDAETRGLRAIAREIHDLARRARAGTLRPDDVSGGTFTVTNPGPYSTVVSVPIINAPQVGILATDAVRRTPVVVECDGADGIGIRAVATIGLSFDHRAVDGAYAASFVHRVAEILSTHIWSRELVPSGASTGPGGLSAR
ncbi:MAG TPA: dihydrolipoamide acetyltransferase family protein [Acidimicrobiia bacterium]|nr:dihydrolipoamide acetyltransferase family protein [Acidimicrobiia bacterium]